MTAPHVAADAVVVGAGAAGLSLLAHLGAAGWEGSVAVIDNGAHPLERRSWAWWSQGDLLLDPFATARFTHARFAGAGWERTAELAPYAYRSITGNALRAACVALAGERIRLEWVDGAVRSISHDGVDPVCTVGTSAGHIAVSGRHMFDSAGVGHDRSERMRSPHLDFLGWRVRCDRDVFDPHVVTLMDFRTSQEHGIAFIYVLPLTAREALVERTVFVVHRESEPLDHPDHLRRYLDHLCGVRDAQVLAVEEGIIPLATPGARNEAVPVGTPAGAVKMSTGYAFERIQRHSERLAAALVGGGGAARPPSSGRWWAALDRALLTLMREDPAGGREVLETLLRRSSASDLLRFLDEDLSPWRQARVYLRLPLWRFVKALAVHACRERTRRKRSCRYQRSFSAREHHTTPRRG